jgi:hypothetical protein
MLEKLQAEPQPGVAVLVEGILHDAQKLVRQEVALAQREVAQAWDRGKTGAALLSSALVVVGVAGIFLGFMLVRLLQQYLLPNQEWACFGIVSCLAALLGGVLIYCGLNQINQVHVSVPQTVETLPEDVPALNGAVSGGGPLADRVLKP